MLFRITLGDWLGKGHDIKEDFLYDCNRPAAEIAAAYGMSREKYGVRFDGFKKTTRSPSGRATASPA